jgi:DNA-binding CsgD family transcriptional regulator
MATGRTPLLRGRVRERELIDAALGRVRGGESAVLVLRGEAGIGKTAVMQYCANRASDCVVIEIAGVESEMGLPYAGVHQLCGSMLDQARALPQPQLEALHVAFGLAGGGAPDRFVVGLGVLGLLAERSAAGPLVCLVDDAQWLDEPSAQVLGFVGRRLLAESVFLLASVREPADGGLLVDLPTVQLSGLSGDDARALLETVIPGPLDDDVRDRIVAETGGNPLGLLELPKGLSAAELAGGFAHPGAGAVTDQLHDHYLRLVLSLPEPTRKLLLLAAADPTGDAALLWRAAGTLGLSHGAAGPAETEQLLQIGSRVRFRHPLVRSASYASGSPESRSEVHLALAAATDPRADPDRQAWHRAEAATGPDEEVAAELVRLAARAEARGGLAAAAAFLQRSVALTAQPELRAQRALVAAHAHLHAGSFEPALGVLAEAEALASDDLQLARVQQLKAEINRATYSGSRAPVLLLQAAHRLEPLDVDLARATYLDAWGASLVAGRLAGPGGDLVEVSAAARWALESDGGGAGPAGPLLAGLSTVVLDGVAQAHPSLREALGPFLGDTLSTDEWLHWGVPAANAALSLWDFDAWFRVSSRHVELARTSGALAPLVAALNVHRVVSIWCGDFETASSLGLTEEAVKDVTGVRRASYGALVLAAYQGQQETAKPLIAATAKEATARGEGLGLQFADRATALLHNGLGHYAEAVTAAERAAQGNLGPFTAQALPDLVEAAVRSGRRGLAADALTRLQAATEVAGSDWAGGLEARSRALLSEGDEAEHWHGEAVARLGRTRLVPELARAHLVFGEWLRREGRRSEAREQLRTAHEIFMGLGAHGFGERARRELLATGEKVRKRDVSTVNELTPQEAQIARLARDGRTNPEIGSELFISARTVEWHLRKVFGKLGITSRKELQAALPVRGRAPASALVDG